jgi:hypothetical protein
MAFVEPGGPEDRHAGPHEMQGPEAADALEEDMEELL